MYQNTKIALVIPCFHCAGQILDVTRRVPSFVDALYVVDDACPEQSGALVKKEIHDPRVRVLTHEHNQGVGGAMISGYRAALADGCDILIKIDGDGQMNTDFLPLFITPLIENRADYVKGNRFFSWRHLKGMPVTRLFGNGALSFISKISTGYWHVMDPTNGYTAIRAEMLRKLNLDGIDRGFFFETDMLFNLAEKKARVLDVPLTSLYHNTQSNLRIEKIIVPFLFKHTQRFLRRMRLA